MTRIHRLYKGRFANMLRESLVDRIIRAAVNVVDEAIDIPSEYELEQEDAFPSGEQMQRDNAEMDFGQMRRIEGRAFNVRRRRSAASGPFSIDDILSPGKHTPGYDNIDDSYIDENTSEDTDVKLGKVEPPYSDAYGPLGTRFDDDGDIVKGADIDKDGVALIEGPAADENKYGAGCDRSDLSIPRDPKKRKLIYRK
jgi:hypothetical protein